MNRKAFLSVGVFFFVIFATILSSSLSFQESIQDIATIANTMFSSYIVAFELLSLILVGGIIGMLYITGRED